MSDDKNAKHTLQHVVALPILLYYFQLLALGPNFAEAQQQDLY